MKKINLKILTLLVLLIPNTKISAQTDIYYINRMKANAEFEKQNYESALQFLNEAIKIKPSEGILYLKSGDANYEIKNFDAAISDYKIASELNENTANYKIAVSYAQIGNAQKAVSFLNLYLKETEKLPEAEIKQNKAFAKIENSTEWINLWKTEHYNTYNKILAEALYNFKAQNYETALTITEKILAANGKRHKALELRGDILFELKDFKNAEKSYINASKIKASEKIYLIKAGNAAFEQKKYDKAAQYYSEAEKTDPYDLSVKLKNAQSLYNAKNYEQASKNIAEYLQFNPENLEAIFLSAQINYVLKDYIKALKEINNCFAKSVTKYEYFELRADIYLETQMYQNASNDYSMALDLFPNKPEIYYKRGTAKIKMHDQNGACSDWNTALNKGYYKAAEVINKYCNK